MYSLCLGLPPMLCIYSSHFGKINWLPANDTVKYCTEKVAFPGIINTFVEDKCTVKKCLFWTKTFGQKWT